MQTVSFAYFLLVKQCITSSMKLFLGKNSLVIQIQIRFFEVNIQKLITIGSNRTIKILTNDGGYSIIITQPLIFRQLLCILVLNSKVQIL